MRKVDRKRLRKRSLATALTLALSCAHAAPAARALESVGPAPAETTEAGHVSITDRVAHYEVELNLESGASHRTIGAEYGASVLRLVPAYEKLVDSYFAEFAPNWLIYKLAMRRVRKIKKQIPACYRDEIEGFASRLSGGKKNRRGDGKISMDELYLLNLLGDVARLTQCSAVAAYGPRSATGHPIVGRSLDWPDGKKAQLAKLLAVVTIKDGERSTVNVACLGFQGAVTSFNSDGVFAAVLDAGTGKHYSARKRRSYVFDLRYALEHYRTLGEVASYMSDPSKPYAYNHLIFLADKDRAAVLENNFSGRGYKMRRALRSHDSELNERFHWNIDNAVGAVNCFMLEGNDPTYIDPLDRRGVPPGQPVPDKNSGRWLNLRQQLLALGNQVSADGIQNVLSYHGNRPRGSIHLGDLYNSYTIYTAIFQPEPLSLKVAFRPRDGSLPARPLFVDVPIRIEGALVGPGRSPARVQARSKACLAEPTRAQPAD